MQSESEHSNHNVTSERFDDVTENELQTRGGNKKDFEISDDESLSMSSISSECMGAVEERATSSMSTSSSKASRIPRLNKSKSLRERPQRLSLDFSLRNKSLSSGNEYSKNQKISSPFGLQRSASFATTRGMKEVPQATQRQNSIPPTPELRRKFPNYGAAYESPYSKKNIDAERKSQNISVPTTKEKDTHSFYSPQISRRPTHPFSSRYAALLHNSSHSGKEGVDLLDSHEDEDNISEKSFESACSAPSCDSASKHSGLINFWSPDRRSRSILHCSHAHDHDPDEYLTPTQRAGRKIRELQGQLKKAKRIISEKDEEISRLTKDLVELRMNHAVEGDICGSKTDEKSERESVQKKAVNRSEQRKSSPLLGYIPSCSTPPSDDSEQELKVLTKGRKSSKTNTVELSRRESKASSNAVRNSPVSASPGDSDFGDISRSLADSGNYEDLPSPSLSSRDSIDVGIPSLRKIIGSICASEGERDSAMIWASVCAAEEGIKAEWSRRLEELKANHMEEYHEIKERHNDKVEMLLSKLSDANLKYFELRPQYDKAQEKVRYLEKELARLKDELRESEIRHQKIYLQMYLKGQQSAKLEENDKFHTKEERKVIFRESQNLDSSSQNMVLTLMKQLAQSENEIEQLRMLQNQEKQTSFGRRSNYSSRRDEIDPEITLQFLKSAIYYFLTDKDNAQGHLRAIESILGYSSVERGTINKYFRI